MSSLSYRYFVFLSVVTIMSNVLLGSLTLKVWGFPFLVLHCITYNFWPDSVITWCKMTILALERSLDDETLALQVGRPQLRCIEHTQKLEQKYTPGIPELSVCLCLNNVIMLYCYKRLPYFWNKVSLCSPGWLRTPIDSERADMSQRT